jgi:tRNA-dihydrouridine synthase
MEIKDQPVICFAPLQESTDFIYRRAHAVHFGGIDKYFSPYITVQKEGEIKKSHLRDTLPENCTGYTLVPQIMAGSSADFLFLSKHLSSLGYNEINWNLGCPYPMVTRKGMGSGLLPQPQKIREILETALPQLSCKISVKLRSGLDSQEDIFKVIPVLNDFPLSEIIFHPRTAKQLYAGSPDWDLFGEVSSLSVSPIVYNGDLISVESFRQASNRFEPVKSWMIGRGMLKNPFLATEIKGNIQGREHRIAVLESFHDDILHNYSALLSGQSHLLTRMTKFWEFFTELFPNPHKAFKRVKKSINLSKYEIAVRENFLQLRSEEID